MKLHRIIELAVATALMLTAVACAGGQSAPTPDIDATVAAGVKLDVAAQPVATPGDVAEEVSSTTPELMPTNTLIPQIRCRLSPLIPRNRHLPLHRAHWK